MQTASMLLTCLPALYAAILVTRLAPAMTHLAEDLERQVSEEARLRTCGSILAATANLEEAALLVGEDRQAESLIQHLQSHYDVSEPCFSDTLRMGVRLHYENPGAVERPWPNWSYRFHGE